VSRTYSTFFGLLSLGLSFGILFEIGLRDLTLVAGSLVGWVPVAGLVSVTIGRLFPPRPSPADERLVP